MYYFSALLATVAIKIIRVNPGPNRSSVSESKIFL